MNNFGYIQVAAASPQIHIGNIKENVEEIKAYIKKGTELSLAALSVIVFPELCLTGYTCGDLFLGEELLDQVNNGLQAIMQASEEYSNSIEESPLIVIGAPIKTYGKLYNCAVVIQNGEILGVVPKTYLPNYNEFYEKRWFTSAEENTEKTVNILGQDVPFGTDLVFRNPEHPEFTVGCEICEDLWMADAPSNHLSAVAGLMINLSASNDVVAKAQYRRDLVRMQSAKCICGYVYAAAGIGESSTDLVFSGHNIIADNGKIIADSNNDMQIAYIDLQKIANDKLKFSNNVKTKNFPVRYIPFGDNMDSILPPHIDAYPFVPKNKQKRQERCEEIMHLQSLGLQQRLRSCKINHVVIGYSAGFDSTLALLVCIDAFDALGIDRVNIHAITMPGFGTSDETVSLSDQILDKLGVTHVNIPIDEACKQQLKMLNHQDDIYDITYENIQARERTFILMNYANMHKGIVIGTGDMSELALGWCTYNGDHMSMYGVNVGVPKTLVKFLVKAAAELSKFKCAENELTSICDRIISPELIPQEKEGQMQDTEGTIGKYDLHDFFLYHFIRNGFSFQKIYCMAIIAFPNVNADEIHKTLSTFKKRFYSQQFKRSCIPDGPKIGSVSLSPRGDWRMPSDASVWPHK